MVYNAKLKGLGGIFMLLRLSMPNRFQFRMMQDWKSMLFHQGGDIHYIGGAEILPDEVVQFVYGGMSG